MSIIELNILGLENGHSKSNLIDFSSFIIRLVIVLSFNMVEFFLRTFLSLVPILYCLIIVKLSEYQ